MSSVLTIKDLTEEEFTLPGNAACPGCAAALSLRIALKVLGPKTIMIVPASCISVIQGYYPKTPCRVPVLNVAFASTAAAGSGAVAALELKGKSGVKILCWAGDGGTADIGLQALSGAAERNENMIYVCYDNEAYMNTGTQRSGATPRAAFTTTTVTGKLERKKSVPEIMIAHRIPYVATACAAFPLDFASKLKRAESMPVRGLKYIHLLSPCPPGWRFPAEKTVEVGKLAVMTGMWILYEWHDGGYSLTGPSKALLEKSRRRPLKDYLSIQGRFGHLKEEDLESLQRDVDEHWEEFSKKLGIRA
ncbi:MAG: 3-methyl-2-oxobutanoate dehydrogenase subunit beta [Candidatus Methanomethyliaceae archaeon]